MSMPDRPWTNTTHDWRLDIDLDHLDSVRQAAGRYGAGGIAHLVLEVVAYAADEAAAQNRRGSCLVELRAGGSVLVADNGRGTATISTLSSPDGAHGRWMQDAPLVIEALCSLDRSVV